MKTKMLLLTLALVSGIVHAQITFERTYGGNSSETGMCVRPTSDGGYIFSGHTQSYGAGSSDIYIVKTNQYGDTMWTRTYGGTGTEEGNAIRQTTDGGYILAGNYMGIYLLKLDVNGNMSWEKSFSGCGILASSNCIEQTSDNGYIITGVTNSFGAGQNDVYLIKTTSTGTVVWTRTFGGPDTDRASAVKQTSDGGFIVVGFTTSFGYLTGKLYVIRTDLNGDTLWTRAVGGNSSENGFAVIQASDGNFVISGYSGSCNTNNGYDFLLVKLDTNGSLLWNNTYGGVMNEWSYGLAESADGGFMLTGFTQSFDPGDNNIFLVRTDMNGDTLWTRVLGGINGQGASSVCESPDGGIIIGGYDLSTGSSMCLIKTDSAGFLMCDAKPSSALVITCTLAVAYPATQVSSGIIPGTSTSQVSFGGMMSTICIALGAEPIDSNREFAIYPNPANGPFSINTQSIGSVQITNLMGEMVYQCDAVQPHQRIDLSDQPNGIYFVSVISEGETFTQKIVIQK